MQRAAEAIATGNATVSGVSGPATLSTGTRGERFARVFRIVGLGSANVYDGWMLWKRDISGGIPDRRAVLAKA